MPIAYFVMNVAMNHENEVIQRIKNVLEIGNKFDYEIQGTYGIYDVVLKVTPKNDDDLKHILLDKIKPIDHIRSVTTMMVI